MSNELTQLESPVTNCPSTHADRELVERLTAGRVRIESELAKVIVG